MAEKACMDIMCTGGVGQPGTPEELQSIMDEHYDHGDTIFPSYLHGVEEMIR